MNPKSTTRTKVSRKSQNPEWARVLVILMVLLMCMEMAVAQQATKVPRIGILSPDSATHSDAETLQAFRQELRNLGYAEGKNIIIEYRYAEWKLDRRERIKSSNELQNPISRF
jgi:hypothetical protein